MDFKILGKNGDGWAYTYTVVKIVTPQCYCYWENVCVCLKQGVDKRARSLRT